MIAAPRAARPQRRSARLTLRVLALSCALAAGCGVSDSGGPERIVVGLGLDDTLPSTTTSTIAPTTVVAPSSTSSVAEATTTIVATESVYLYFISGNQLNFISIPLTSPASLGQVMAALQAGPDALGAPGAGLRSAVPDQPPIGVVDGGDGSARVDLPATFFDEISQADQIRAIGQIVLTLTSQRGIGGVVFSRAGQPTGVALGSGEQSEMGRTVTRADYRTLIIGQSDGAGTTAGSSSTTTTSIPTATTAAAAPSAATTTVGDAPPPSAG